MSQHDAGDSQRLVESLVQKAAVSRELLDATCALDREITGWLIPTIQRRREELARLQRRLRTIDQQDQAAAKLTELERQVADSRRETEGLRAGLAHAQAEASILRQSRSWRVTAPLRAAYDLLHRLLGSGNASSAGAAGDRAPSQRSRR